MAQKEFRSNEPAHKDAFLINLPVCSFKNKQFSADRFDVGNMLKELREFIFFLCLKIRVRHGRNLDDIFADSGINDEKRNYWSAAEF